MSSQPTEPIEPVIDVRLRPGVLALIAVGGALGALSRYGVSRIIHVPTDGFPRSTFTINLVGAFVLGCFLTVVHRLPPPSRAARYGRPLFAIGFLGAFTTFSTMAVETATLVKDGHALLGIAYLVASIACGLATCALGVLIARALTRTHLAGGA